METFITNKNGMRLGKWVSDAPGLGVRLQPKEVFSLEIGRSPVEIIAQSGSVWVTSENELQDRVLNAGEKVVISRRGRVVIEGLPQGGIQVNFK